MKKMYPNILYPIILIILSGCGGSSSETSTNVPSPPTMPATPDPAPAPTPAPEVPTTENMGIATPTFTNVTQESGLSHLWGVAAYELGKTPEMTELFSNGIGAGDFDQDGDIDLFINGGDKQPGKLFRNEGNNTFNDITDSAGLTLDSHLGSGASFADIDGDGWLDLFVGGIIGSPNYLFRNKGDGSFENIISSSGLNLTVRETISASFADYNKDGFIDIAVSHWGAPVSDDGQHLWKGLGEGKFTSANLEAGLSDTIIDPDIAGAVGQADYTFTPNFADFDNDGYVDLAFVADFNSTQLYMNNQNSSFVNMTTDTIDDQNGMGSAIGDYDNDGDLDWFVTSIYPFDTPPTEPTITGNRLYQNQGDGTFQNVTFAAGVVDGGWGWGACFADFNNDGYLDLFHTNGWGREDDRLTDKNNDFREDPAKLFINQQDGTFLEVANIAGVDSTRQGRGITCFDSDNDGDVDILINHNNTEVNTLAFYRNDIGSTQGNYIIVNLKGEAPNTQALGARIYVSYGEVTQMREINANSNFVSQNPSRAHFGLGEQSSIDTLRVVWPDNTETTMANVEANQILILQPQ